MPKNAAGTYTQPAGTAAVSGQVASSSAFNTLISDIATVLTGDLPRGGGVPMLGELPMGNNRISGIADATTRTDAAAAAQMADGEFDWYGDISGADTKTLVTNGFAPGAYANGYRVRARNVTANAGAVTLNVASIGAADVELQGGAALTGGEIPAGHICVFEYDTNFNAFIFVNPPTGAGTGLTLNGANLDFDPDTLATLSLLGSGDTIVVTDSSDSNDPKKVPLGSFLNFIPALTAETDPASDDEVVIYDTSALASRSMTLENLAKALGLAEIETITPTLNQTDILFDNIPSGRTALVMFIKGLQGDSTTQFRCAMSDDNGSTFMTARGGAAGTETGSGAARSVGATGQTNGTQITPDNVVTSDNIFGILFFPAYSEASTQKWFAGITITDVNGGMGSCWSVTEAAEGAIDAINLDFALGDFDAAGSATLYSWG